MGEYVIISIMLLVVSLYVQPTCLYLLPQPPFPIINPLTQPPPHTHAHPPTHTHTPLTHTHTYTLTHIHPPHTNAKTHTLKTLMIDSDPKGCWPKKTARIL